MTMTNSVPSVEVVSNRLTSVFLPESARVMGVPTPRIHTPLNDLPSRGPELIDLASSMGIEMMEWQKFALIHSHKYLPDGRYATPLNLIMCARQNGKSFLMQLRILGGLFLWDEPLQIGSAHRLNTSVEQFRQLVTTIESHEFISKQVSRIRWTNGAQEIEIKGSSGINRFMVKAGGSAARGSSPTTLHLDEIREMKDMESFASLRYTLMAAKNPMTMAYTTQGDSHSIVLKQLRDRGIAAANGAADDIGFFEWSAPTDEITLENAAHANPGLGITIHENNLRSVFNDPRDVVLTEVLNREVQTLSGIFAPEQWNACLDEKAVLNEDELTWLGLDLSPDRRFAALCGAQKRGDGEFVIKLLHTWENSVSLDDKLIANETAAYCRKYPIEHLAYSKRTSGNVAARLVPAGIPIFDMDSDYPQSCDELLSAVNSKRLRHSGQSELTIQMLSAVQLRRGDGGWVIGRRVSGSAVCASVAAALCTHFATRAETEFDILVG